MNANSNKDMKKVYKAPTNKMIDLSGEEMIAQSVIGFSEEEITEGEGDVKAASRLNLWDDEW